MWPRPRTQAISETTPTESLDMVRGLHAMVTVAILRQICHCYSTFFLSRWPLLSMQYKMAAVVAMVKVNNVADTLYNAFTELG